MSFLSDDDSGDRTDETEDKIDVSSAAVSKEMFLSEGGDDLERADGEGDGRAERMDIDGSFFQFGRRRPFLG